MGAPVGGRKTREETEEWAAELRIATGLVCKVAAGIEEAKGLKTAAEVEVERQQQLQEPNAVDAVAVAAVVVGRRVEEAEVE